MSFMFKRNSSLKEVNVSNFYTFNINKMNGIFNRCSSLKKINHLFFTVDNVTEMNSILENVDLSIFNTNNINGERIKNVA